MSLKTIANLRTGILGTKSTVPNIVASVEAGRGASGGCPGGTGPRNDAY